MAQDGISAQDVHKTLGGKSVLAGITFDVPPGSALAVIGPSGSGKTTLLKCMNLLQEFEKGRLFLGGKCVAEVSDSTGELVEHLPRRDLRLRVGMVFQEWNLWPNRTVKENVSEGVRFVLCKEKQEAYRRAERICADLGLSNKLASYPHQLSGGEKQRTAIARALAMEPSVLLLDEITSSLDPSLVAEVLEVIAGLKNDKRSLIVVTHHMEFARAVADSVGFLWGGAVPRIRRC